MNEAKIGDRFSVKKAHEAQLRMSRKIIFQDKLPKRIQLVAGVDTSYAGEVSIGAVAVLDYDSLKLVETQTSFCRTQFPYVSTLLSFREINPAVLCIRRLQTQPDVLLVDGHGFAHPYHCGLASHLGLVLGKPSPMTLIMMNVVYSGSSENKMDLITARIVIAARYQGYLL
jgi:deoxyribonuclease V